MPLAVSSGVAPPTVLIERHAPFDPGTIFAQWFAPDGTVWVLTPPVGVDYGWLTMPGIVGWGATPVNLAADLHPRGGSRVRHRRAEPRTITWPLHVWGDTHQQLLERRRALTLAFTQTRRLGPGILRVSRPDGSARQISGWYIDGAQGNAAEDWLHANLIIQLLCEDPFWRDSTPTVAYREAAASVDFQDPFPSVSSAQILGATTIVNSGDVEAWPQWVITGPADAVEATNNTTGQSWTLTYDLADGDQITVSTEPPAVRGPADAVLTGALDWPNARLWSLQPGSNDITFNVTGSAAGTVISWSYYRRYETA